MSTTGCGYILLGPEDGVDPKPSEIAAALQSQGWERWDGTGPPAIAIFHVAGPKGDYFEAGYWCGRGVPLFFLGGGSRCTKRKQIVGRMGGWTIVGENNRASIPDLIAAIERYATERPIGAKKRESGPESTLASGVTEKGRMLYEMYENRFGRKGG